MKQILSLAIVMLLGINFLLAQTQIDSVYLELTKDQRKHEMQLALKNGRTGGVTIFFEAQKAEKVKGQKRTYERYEMELDANMKIVSGAYKTLGTRFAIKPRIYYNDFRIAYTIWTDEEYTMEVPNKKGEMKTKTVPYIVFEIIKYDNENNVIAVEDYYLCEEKGFDSYRVLRYKGELIVMAQYEKKKGAQSKEEKNPDFIVYKRIDPATMQVKTDKELNLLGKDELGMETFTAINDKVFLVGKQLLQTKVLGIKVPKSFMIFRLDLEGNEEARSDIAVPLNGVGIGSIYLYADKETLYMCGEYGDPKAIGTPPAYPAGSKTVKVTNPYLGMFIKKFNMDLKELGTATFDYKEKILKKTEKRKSKIQPT